MAGEMYGIDPVTGEEPDGTVWSAHAAIAQAVGGTVQPFDQYQGPYVLIGPESRVGARPYAMPLPGATRLWVNTDWDGCAKVYREDTDTESEIFPMFDDEMAADAALSLI